MDDSFVKIVNTQTLAIAYMEYGAADGWPVILCHGFPYDARAFDQVAPYLVAAGAKVYTPFTRGFGQTRFLSENTARNAQQAIRALDIIEFAEALGLNRPILGGFDWGGNASCTAAALWPDKISGLVSYAGYDIIDVQQQRHALSPSLEKVCWYQHLFQSERGRECLVSNRYEIGRLLWQEWSPNWNFDEKVYARTAAAFDNPDFVDIVIHCYRFMHGKETGDPALQHLEDRLAQKPAIRVPTVTIDGTADPLKPGGTADHARWFSGRHEHIITSAGHNIPQEAPPQFAGAVLKLHDWLP
ncbi:alpha/beta hydrolase [Mucilaginibacter gynuensis]|uniref:Alpha/beta hydrolase n=1 Tax=Mucilaginibacter gynuensis TaxID=1302236 RepID=A0ABP8FS01_9SPHI